MGMSKEEIMYYIYCYTNKINGHKYIGQTSYPARRKSEHRYAAFTPSSEEYNLLFHKKLRQYGEENFSFEILEEIDSNDLKIVDNKESYWIEKMSSHVKTGKGYNLTLGGQGLGRHKKISEEKIRLIVELLGNSQLTQKAIAEQVGVSQSTIININRGIGFQVPGVSYPVRQNGISDNIKQGIAYLLINTNKTRQQIADEMGVSLSTVKRIKSGETKVEGYNFPIR